MWFFRPKWFNFYPNMKFLMYPLIALSAIYILVGCQSQPTLFEEMSANKTGIEFRNDLIYTDSLTVLDFEYMYNGAGVAVGDVNNDGLQDLYFTANMSSNRLYINQGGWKFKDVTDDANLATSGWSNGAAMVDLNQDGHLDIYVSRGGPRGTEARERANLLYINNGDLTFTESAAQYGLDNQEFNVQAAFFDYDLDGDLDAYLLTNALVNFNRNVSRPIETTGKAPSVDRLFRNNGDLTFTDVSDEAGILIEGFGLGVKICDLNQDQKPDIYVSNDFLTDDLIYINQGDGSFKNEAAQYLKHQTYNGMGNDVADYNNDGLVDIVVLDMLPEDNLRRKLTLMGNNYDEFENNLSFGYQPQYLRNTLQLNNGNGSFSEIGQLAGIDATDWSWSALFADYDNDGFKDLFITNGYRQDVTNLDFIVYGQQTLKMGESGANKKLRLEALDELPGSKVSNYLYHNQRDLTFKDVSMDWGIQKPSYSNGGVYADLDNDGDLDLVINNIDEPALIYQNHSRTINSRNYLSISLEGPSGNLQGLGAEIWLYSAHAVQYQYYSPYRGYISSVDPRMHFGLDSLQSIERLVVRWPDGKTQLLQELDVNQNITLKYSQAHEQLILDESAANITIRKGTSAGLYQQVQQLLGIDFRHQENTYVDYKVQPTKPHLHSRNGPGIAVADINRDGLFDFFIGGAFSQSGRIYLQKQNGSFERSKMKLDSLHEDMGSLFFDADLDGDQDLYVVSGGVAPYPGSDRYQDRLYLNDGKGMMTIDAQALPELTQSGSTVVAADYDRDGDLDLFVGGRLQPGSYPLSPQSTLLVNQLKESGSAHFKQADMADDFANMGMVTSALWTDFNGDQWTDLIVVGEFMPIRFYENQRGQLVEVTANTGLEFTNGWWNSVTSGDFDSDGDLDYVLGNLGLNSRYRASPEEPLCIYAHDFDKNGRVDPIMCYFIDGKNYIAHSRDDLIDQINAMRARFRTYQEYAESTFEQSFLPDELAQAEVVKSEYFQSSYLENLGGGSFKLTPLPIKAQFAPLYGMSVQDVNGDQHLDLLGVGNFYSSEVSVGRYDAHTGLVLLGNGKGSFEPMDVVTSGFFADQDAKGLAYLPHGSGASIMLVSNNDQELQAFIGPKTDGVYQVDDLTSHAMVYLEDNRSYIYEFSHGSTYLSSSARVLPWHSGIKEVVLYKYDGSQTKINHP